MSDIVRQLRSHHDALFLDDESSHLSEAAAEIESLRAENTLLRDAARPELLNELTDLRASLAAAEAERDEARQIAVMMGDDVRLVMDRGVDDGNRHALLSHLADYDKVKRGWHHRARLESQ